MPDATPSQPEDSAWMDLELRRVYDEMERLSQVAQALYVGIAMIVEALENLEARPHANAMARMHLRLALAEARAALRLAEPVMETQ